MNHYPYSIGRLGAARFGPQNLPSQVWFVLFWGSGSSLLGGGGALAVWGGGETGLFFPFNPSGDQPYGATSVPRTKRCFFQHRPRRAHASNRQKPMPIANRVVCGLASPRRRPGLGTKIAPSLYASISFNGMME
ncbi:hypothetical protein TRVL_08790 [Trypanosoma vivax]|nr:hypothetical protein TRVL_08790 [Trypanosoma vivax]